MQKIKYLPLIIIFSLVLISTSCKKDHEDVFYIEGTIWHATWLENNVEIDATITFGEEICIIEIFDVQNGDFVKILPYFCDNDDLVFSIDDNLEIINFNQSRFVWYDFPYAESMGYDVTFVRKK